ncbi:MAG: hypothetical protein R3C11_07935 [Planctomycetaceae bacterium]
MKVARANTRVIGQDGETIVLASIKSQTIDKSKNANRWLFLAIKPHIVKR